ncbi:MAG: DNA recombination protein RmuC [bacterium ADurb.Bin400]|nr:MAG: DNA recombination protein RmuC [bacterium ADurb.Bin400]
MDNLLITLVAALIVILTIVATMLLYLIRKIGNVGKNDLGLSMLNSNLQSLQNNFVENINRTNQAINERLDNAAYLLSQVGRELGQMQQIGSQLRDFQNFLRSPKLRGNLSEQGLKELLSQALPRKHFDLQYAFRNGAIVDAIIHLEAGKIPIDAKFPLENFSQMLKASSQNDKDSYRKKFKNDFKSHVDAIAKKYLNPDEGTTDLAFMYLPSESIFFEVVNNEHELFEYAAERHVIVSSPSTFFYYLRTIMLGLEGRKISEMSQEILLLLKTIRKESSHLGDTLSVLNKHVNNSAKAMTSVNDCYSKLANKIEAVQLSSLDQTHEALSPVQDEEV